MTVLPRIDSIFNDNGISTEYYIHLADVEAEDQVLLEHTHETTETYYAKTRSTLSKIKDAVYNRGYDNVHVDSMNNFFSSCGIRYVDQQMHAADYIFSNLNMRVRSVLNNLIAERKRVGDFVGINPDQQLELVVAELAGYAAYGSVIAGKAIIISPDAMSATPAYNYFVSEKSINPVFYVK